MRVIRGFLQFTRLGANTFEWFHPTAIELATFWPTTPITVLLLHGMVHGMWVGISNSTIGASINGGFFRLPYRAIAVFPSTGRRRQG